LPERVTIGVVEDGEFQLINMDTNEPIEPPIRDIELFVRTFGRARLATGGQRNEGQRQQQRGGERPEGGARNRERR